MGKQKTAPPRSPLSYLLARIVGLARLSLTVGTVLFTVLFAVPGVASAQQFTTTTNSGMNINSGGGCTGSAYTNAINPGGSGGGNVMCCPQGVTNATDCFYAKYINPAIKILGILGGIAAVGGIIWGGIQYGMSAGDAQKVTKAKGTIQKALLGLVALFLFVPLLNFLAPGGIQSNATNGGGSAANCSKSTTFLGFKPWYAYLPNKVPGTNTNTFDAKCQISGDLQVLPSGNNNGVLGQVVLAIVDDMLHVAALVAVAFVLIGGVKYLTSQGEPAKTKEALSSIINALIGLAIAVIAAAVVSYIGNKLSG